MKKAESKATAATSELGALSPVRRRMLFLFSFLFIFWAAIWLVSFFIQRGYTPALLVLALIVIETFLVFLLNNNWLRPKLFAHLTTLQIIIGISASNYFTGGLAGNNVVPYFLVPVAGILMAGRSGLVWLFITIAVAVFFELATLSGYEFPHLVAQENRALDQTITWLSTLFIITFTVFGYERSRLRQQLELLKAKKDAENAALARARFLASMSHEFRTPLNNILVASGMLAEDTSDPSTRERLHQIRQSAYALLGMVEDALDVARVENGQLQIFVAPFDPAQVASDVIEQMQVKLSRKGLASQLDKDADLPRYVRGDAFRYRQILVNLLDNAIKFTERGKITVRLAAPSSGWLKLIVDDTGPGIEPRRREQIFEPFVSGVQKNFIAGAGLGLTICRNLTTALGGSIEAGDAPGGGARFVVLLPFPAWQREGVQDKERSILLVEDDPVGRELVEAILTKAGYRVTAVPDGIRALMLASQTNFSLLLVDVRLPGITGPELARHLRSGGGRLAQVPILALTADAVAEQRELCFKAGMNDFITKPIEVKSLLAAVEKWLQ